MQRPPKTSIRMLFRAWGELFRLPNLLTVPGDPIAGFVLAQTFRSTAAPALSVVAPPVLAGILLYCAGLLWNDCWDYAEDIQERPNRPLASGRACRTTAAVVAWLIAICGLLVAALAGKAVFQMAIVLVVLILAYDGLTKNIPVLGPLNMGACRASSLLLGAATIGIDAMKSPLVVLAAVGLGAYVAAVTWIASREKEMMEIRRGMLLSLAIFAIWFAVLSLGLRKGLPRDIAFFLAVGMLALAGLVYAVREAAVAEKSRLAGSPTVQKAVGLLILNLILVQAWLISTAGLGWMCPVFVLLLCYPAALLLGTRFYSS